MNNISLLIQSTGPAPGGATQTVITDYANVTEEAELTTNRFDSPAKLSFTCLENGPAAIVEGSSVELTADGVKLFKGYVFSAERDENGKTSYVAYDQLRYLKASASYTFENVTLEEIVKKIAADFGLKTGVLEETGYVFTCLIKENESCLDIIFDTLSETIRQTGRIFNFYDDYGALTITEAKNMLVTTLVGDNSLITGYTYKRDIDSDTYNRVKLVRKNEETGRNDVYVHEDAEMIKSWGLLQYCDEVDKNMNEAQIDEMCKMYLQYYNRVLQTISFDAIGIPGIRAGTILPVKIGAVDDLSAPRLLLAEKVTHNFEPDSHTMSIEVKSFQQLGGISIV